MLGQAALAMWWDMAPSMREEFEDWHSREHFPERLALPGFLRASRWADAGGGEGFFVLYELATRDALVSPEYLARLNAPTPWSTRLMPHHRNMVRTPSVVLQRHGMLAGSHLLTVRFASSGAADPDAMRQWVAGLPAQESIAGAILLRHEPLQVGTTTEQRIRGLQDRAADGILLVAGDDLQALHATVASDVPAPLGGGDVHIGCYALRLAIRADETAQRGQRG